MNTTTTETRMITMTRNRPAFTLMELLVVVSLLVILMAILLAAVFGAFSKSSDAAVLLEIRELSEALEEFKKDFGIYPPSQMFLAKAMQAYDGMPTNTMMKNESLDLMRRLFPRISPDAHDWNMCGFDKYDAASLEGDQCLVFFLGGCQDLGAEATPPRPNRVVGFSSNPRHPSDFGSGAPGKIYYQFKSERLVIRKTVEDSSYFVYLDPYGTPYAYFSSGNRENNYSRFGGTDCQTLGVFPYANVWNDNPLLRKYENPSSFQLISAGRDKMFGKGTFDATSVWTQTTAATSQAFTPVNPNPAKNGKDDLGSFSTRKLGAS